MGIARPIVAALGVLVIAVLGGKVAGLHLNHTASYPRGLWIEASGGDGIRPYVLACADHTANFETYRERGYLPWGVACSGTAPLLKRIWARPGDHWSVTPEGVVVNGELVSNTRPLDHDSAGRPLTSATGGTVQPGHVLLLSDYSPRSLDGRYFGTMPITQVLKEVKPLWTE